MPYRYLEDVATSDLAFEATGPTLESAFSSAADALLGGMVEVPATVAPREERTIRVEADAEDRLLLRFLQELIYLKDTERLLLRVPEIQIRQTQKTPCAEGPLELGTASTPLGASWNLELAATARGEPIDPSKHELTADVKAVTLHMLKVEPFDGGWKATAVVDV